MARIKKITAREILDSRGIPTIETTVRLENGISASAGIPSGASTGSHEALELRDGDKDRYNGKGVLKAIGNVENKIFPALKNKNADDQKELDQIMIDLDGTDNKSSLGANSILSVSLAAARCSAINARKPLYAYLRELAENKADYINVTPFFNVINGGLHGSGNFNFQEFMIIPDKKYDFGTALKMGSAVYQLLKKILIKKKLVHSVGDEGGFTPDLETNQKILQLLKEVIEQSDYQYKKDISLGLDLAASTFYLDGLYEVDRNKKRLSYLEYIDYLKKLDKEFDFASFEDLMTEEDWQGWIDVYCVFGENKMVVGDDLLVTNKKRLERAMTEKACNSIIIKLNQIGTLTETLEVIEIAQKAGFKVIISHRSGETNDDFIADLAVGTKADYVKFGAPARGERVAKYNRLSEIYSEINRKS